MAKLLVVLYLMAFLSVRVLILRLQLLDYARFLAASSVVLYHYFYSGVVHGNINSIDLLPISNIASYGYLGVQFFFIISGYVIFFSIDNKDATSFLKSRLKRIYPSYWFAVILTSLFIYAFGDFSIVQSTVNLTMIQQVFGIDHIDGVYWTLFYELIFYSIIFFLLLFFNHRYLVLFLIVWPVLILIFNLIGMGFFIFNLYFSFFIIGCMFCLKYKKIINNKIVNFSLLLSVALGGYQIYQSNYQVGNNLIIISFIYFLFLVFFNILNKEKFRSLELPFSKVLGGITYPLYLVHATIGYLLIDRFANSSNYYFVYLAVIVLVFTISILMWLIIDIKQGKLWGKVFSVATKPLSAIESAIKKGLN